MKKQFFSNPILVLSMLTAIAMAASEVSLWVSVFSCVMVLWKLAIEKNWMRPIPNFLAPTLGAFIFFAVYAQYRTLWGQEPSAMLMLGLASVTILNFGSDRDHQFLVLLGFIIIVIKTIFSIDLIWTAPSLLAFFGLWLSLLKNQKISKYRFLFWQLTKSLPVFLILFFLFPRIVLFQGQQLQKKQAKIGISDDLSPGDIEEVAAQDGLAFRAELVTQTHLPINEMYWRGSVLTVSNNFEWDKGSVFEAKSNLKNFTGPKVQYKIILEPTSRKFIFALDLPTRITESNAQVQSISDNTFRTIYSTEQQVHYTALSMIDANLAIDPKEDMSEYLQTAELPPRTKAWVDQTKQQFKTKDERLKALSKFFTNPSFVYTLKPGRYKDMDEFLFVRRKGFCEHYATAFATMARALDIPARVVIGYQGGSYNIAGSFWKVSQKDAHAWTEIATNGQWQRVDPTQWVSILRLNLGGEAFFALSEDDQVLFSHTPGFKQELGIISIWNDLTTIFENLNYKWTLFLLDFDKQKQLDFLKELRSEWPTALLILILLAVLVTTIVRSRRPVLETKGLNPISKLMLFIEFKCKQMGININQANSPSKTFDDLSLIFKDDSKLISRFRKEYEAVLYQNKEPEFEIAQWKKEWTAFFKQKVSK